MVRDALTGVAQVNKLSIAHEMNQLLTEMLVDVVGEEELEQFHATVNGQSIGSQ